MGERGRSSNDGLKSILKDSGFVDSSIEGQDNASFDEDDIKSKKKDSKIRKKHKKDKTDYKTTMLQMAVPVMVSRKNIF